MTDTHSPITGPLPAPMFDSGPQPVAPPNTEPHPAPIFDTGPHPDPLTSQAFSEVDDGLEGVDTDAFLRSVTSGLDYPPAPAPTATPAVVPAQPAAQPAVVPGSYQFVKRWKFALLVSAVWLVSAAAGLGFYFWWYTALDKTLPVFGILLYLVVCMVGSLLVSMVPDRPQLTALAIALMAAPLASTFAAAVLHGAYYFEWIVRPAIG